MLNPVSKTIDNATSARTLDKCQKSKQSNQDEDSTSLGSLLIHLKVI